MKAGFFLEFLLLFGGVAVLDARKSLDRSIQADSNEHVRHKRSSTHVSTLQNCREIMQNDLFSESGTHSIYINCNSYSVYCLINRENNTAYTFFRKDDYDNIGGDLDLIRWDKTSAAVLFLRNDNTQGFGIVEQLDIHDDKDIYVGVNSIGAYQNPSSAAIWGDYLYLGVLPRAFANDPANANQGFKFNGQDVAYTNTDQNPSHYFLFSQNPTDAAPAGAPVDFNQYQIGRTILSLLITPDTSAYSSYFVDVELHFGGGGIYYGSTDAKQIKGAMLGVQ